MPSSKGVAKELPAIKVPNSRQKTFLGGASFKGKIAIFVALSCSVIAAFSGLYLYVDQRTIEVFSSWKDVRGLSARTTEVAKRFNLIQNHRRRLISTRDTLIIDSITNQIDQLNRTLNNLNIQFSSNGLEQQISTLRDGLMQYTEHLENLAVTALNPDQVTKRHNLNIQHQKTSAKIISQCIKLGLSNLVSRIRRIDYQSEEVLTSGSMKIIKKIDSSYLAINEVIKKVNIAESDRFIIQDLLQIHEKEVRSQIYPVVAVSDTNSRLIEIAEYMQPNIDSLSGLASKLEMSAASKIKKFQVAARYLIGIGSLIIFAFFIFFTILLIKSLTTPGRQLANVADRLAKGARVINIPARGNSDDFGIMARAFDTWVQLLEINDELREELEKSRLQLEKFFPHTAHTERTSEVPTMHSDATLNATIDPSTIFSEVPPFPETTNLNRMGSKTSDLQTMKKPTGSLTSASQQLEYFSQFVSVAANGVERTESLINNLNNANQTVADISTLVINIRNDIKHLSFDKFNESEKENNNLVSYSNQNITSKTYMPRASYSEHISGLQKTAKKIGDVLITLKHHLDDVNFTAQEIASSASSQALEATQTLLTQSENLQLMLDGLLEKMHQKPEIKKPDNYKISEFKRTTNKDNTPE